MCATICGEKIIKSGSQLVVTVDACLRGATRMDTVNVMEDAMDRGYVVSVGEVRILFLP